MPEPCRSCDRRTEDFGGCRCQALLLTGDASATDPACSLAPSHLVIELALLEVPIDTASAPPQGEVIYRVKPKRDAAFVCTLGPLEFRKRYELDFWTARTSFDTTFRLE